MSADPIAFDEGQSLMGHSAARNRRRSKAALVAKIAGLVALFSGVVAGAFFAGAVLREKRLTRTPYEGYNYRRRRDDHSDEYEAVGI